MSTKLYVALNKKTPEDALNLATELNKVDEEFGYKLNGDLLSIYGIKEVIPKFVELGRPIFADMKMFKGKGSMAWMIETLADLEVEYTNVACQAKKEFISNSGKIALDNGIKLLGLTIQSYETEESCQEKYGKSFNDSVRYFSEIANGNDCDGLILPATALHMVSDIDIPKFTPGIRPEWEKDHGEQKQVVTPREAIESGATAVIVGGPIYKAECPSEALRKILEEL